MVALIVRASRAISRLTPAARWPRSCRSSPSTGAVINVCLMIDNLSLAGTERHVVRLINRVDRSKVRPFLCLLDGQSEPSRSLEPNNCPVIRLGVRSFRRGSAMASAWRLARFLRRKRIDVLQVYFPDSTYFGAVVGRLAGCPRIVRARRSLGDWMRPIDRKLSGLFGRLVDATITNCQACRNEVIAEEGIPPRQVVVVPNGIDAAAFGRLAAPSSNGGSGRSRRVGVVANLRPVKGLGTFVEAARILQATHGDVHFEVVGEGPSCRDLEGQIRQLGLEGRVQLSGATADVASSLAQWDVAVLCSRSEGLSNALLEYMAAARPIVASSVGGNGELVENERHALLVPPADPASLARAIARLLDDRPLAARLARRARERALRHFSTEAEVQRYQTLWAQLVRGPGHR